MQYTNLQTSIDNAFLSKDFFTAEKLSVEAIQKNSLDSQVWLYLTKALAFRGFGASARKTLERAWLLDPQAIWIDELQKDIDINDKGLERLDIDEILKVKNVSVCAVLIVKYEESFIEKCVSSLINVVDEIIIVNTSPSEIVIEVKKLSEKIRVIEYDCRDDYSAARNAVFTYIKSDWAFFTDTNECIFNDDIINIRIAVSLFDSLKEPVLLRVGIVDKGSNGNDIVSYDAVRLFPVKYGFRYSSKIYDEVFIDDKKMFSRTISSYPVRIRLKHFGYMKPETEVKEKLKKNIGIIKELVEGDLNDPLPFFLIGRDLFFSGKYNISIFYFNKYIETAERAHSFGRISDAYIFLIKAYIQLQKNEEAEATCIKAINIRNDSPDLQYLHGLIKFKKAQNYFMLAEEFVIKSKQSFATYRSVVSPDSTIFDWKADLLHADIALITGNLEGAKILFEKAFKMSPDKIKESILKKLTYIQDEKKKVNKILMDVLNKV